MVDLEAALSDLTVGIDELKAVIRDAERAEISAATWNSVVEMTALRAASVFETYLESLFFASMLAGHPADAVGPVIPVGSKADVELLIYADGPRRQKYLSWLPWESTKDRASAYLQDGSPFGWLQYRAVETQALSDLTTVRNAVAHPSDYAFQLLQSLADDRGYKVSRPADYLLSLRGGDTEVLLLLTQVAIVGRALAAASESAADALLQPEQPFSSGKKGPRGVFDCLQCGHELTITAAQSLPMCPNCGVKSKCPTCGHVTATSSTWKRRVL